MNVKKFFVGTTLGTALLFGSISSAVAAEPTGKAAKKVELQQQAEAQGITVKDLKANLKTFKEAKKAEHQTKVLAKETRKAEHQEKVKAKEARKAAREAKVKAKAERKAQHEAKLQEKKERKAKHEAKVQQKLTKQKS